MTAFDHIASQPDGQHPETPDCDCEKDPIAALVEMFVGVAMGRRIGGGQHPVLRPVFLKPHGVVGGIFTIRSKLPKRLKVGVFAGKSYPAWVRFSSDTTPMTPDLTTTCGIGIKLFGVPGEKLLPPNSQADTHDFLFQNHDVFFVDTARTMCEFTHAGVLGSGYEPYLAAHPKTARILDDMEKLVPSVLESEYWSVLPYAFGDKRYVKYKLAPVGARGEPLPGLSTDDPDYLHADLRHRLLAEEVSFHFLVQFQTDPPRMPLDEATIRWQESASPPVLVATLTLPRQDIDATGQAEYGENLAFNPWHALAEHAPVGSVAEARRAVYEASADRRREANDVPLTEPDGPRPIEIAGASTDHRIVRAAIHPAIGIARVGDSEDHFFIGPEVDGPLSTELGESAPAERAEPGSGDLDKPAPDEHGPYKDRTGALKRQATRFRVYGYNAAGEVVAELTAEQADIRWSAHVANRKAAWYQFQIALDIPEASLPAAQPTELRNADVTGAARDQLVIDPGARTIHGRNQAGPQYRFDSGEFCGKKVYLGELRTDDAGRLIFLGGRGVSASSDGSPATTFANNDKWHDDVSDGPVTAEVRIDGKPIPVDPAWVVVAPPNYAPDVVGVRTMYDLLYDTYVQCGWIPFPQRVSFSQHVLPLLTRLVGLQWVNHGFATRFGFGGTEYFLAPAYLERLASPLPEHAELRQQVWAAFREWERDGESPLPWPWLYGDSMSLPTVSARQHTMLTTTQLTLLERWAAGDFEADLDPGEQLPQTIEKVPLAEQPATLDRAALTYCLADAFHPGCEMTWPMRHPSMYMAPFRLRHRSIGDTERSRGTTLTPEVVSAPDGPLYGQSPGSISRWMAVPWQTDTASCLSGYDPGYGRRYDPYLPTFWPARVPNQVLTARDYDAVMDESRPLSERRTAFERRAVWLRWLEGRYMMQINQMVRDFGKLGVIETRPGPPDGDFPRRILVESEVGFEREVNPRRNLRPLHVPEARDPATAETAIAHAVHARGLKDEEVVAGYIEKVDRFPRR